jgi:hypothetical protein
LDSQPANSRVHEISRSLATCPPRWTAINLSPLRRLASSRLATLNTQYLGLYPANPRVHEISPISATHPSRWMVLIFSPLRRLASSRLVTLNTQYSGFHLRTPEFTRSLRSLPRILHRWTVLIFSPLHCFATSRLATFNTKSSALPLTSFRVRSDLTPEIYPSLQRALFLFLFRSDSPHAVGNFGWDPTISDASPPSLHILLTWKNFDSALIPPEPTLFLFVHRCTF